MPLSRRYTPEHSPGDTCTFGMDMSFIIPPGVGIQAVVLDIYTNTYPPVLVNTDWAVAANNPTWEGRVAYARITGGVEGTDYQFRWLVIDTNDNVWTRVGLVQCALTS